MPTLISYLNELPKEQRLDFVTRCKTSEGYLRKAASIGQNLGMALCIAIESESLGAIRCETMRPDIDWSFLRNQKASHA